MTSIYFPRENSVGFSGEEFQLETPGCVPSKNILIFPAVTANAHSQPQYQSWKVSISLLAWAKKEGLKLMKCCCVYFKGTFNHFGGDFTFLYP